MESVRVSCSGGDGPGGTTSVRFSGIPKAEQEKVEAVSRGHYWMTVVEGKLVFTQAREPLPSPTEDSELLPFWRQYDSRQSHQQEMVFDNRELYDSPSFMVSHLCGYHYTPESYVANAQRLESYGFECLRSRRGNDGRYTEIWYLPGAWAAEGELKAFVEKMSRESREGDKKQSHAARQRHETRKIVSFLCQNVFFGTLDVVVQRAAMILEDE